MDEQMKSYFSYWGKAKKDSEQSGLDYRFWPVAAPSFALSYQHSIRDWRLSP